MKSNSVKKLDEAKYFHKHMAADFNKFKREYVHHLNAFLNSARSVTLVMQKDYKHTEGFEAWYEAIKTAMPPDFREFTQIRDISIHQKSIEPSLLNGQASIFPKGLTIPGQSSAEVKLVTNLKEKKIYVAVTHSDGQIEESTRPLMVDFVVYEAANKKHKEIVVDDFMEVSKLYLKFLELIVEDCDKKFTKPSSRNG